MTESRTLRQFTVLAFLEVRAELYGMFNEHTIELKLHRSDLCSGGVKTKRHKGQKSIKDTIE